MNGPPSPTTTSFIEVKEYYEGVRVSESGEEARTGEGEGIREGRGGGRGGVGLVRQYVGHEMRT